MITDSHQFRSTLNGTEILLNVHPSEYNHMFDDQFLLPALLYSVLVVSEVSPFQEQVPYHEYITWSTIHNMMTALLDMQNNFHAMNAKVHGAASQKHQVLATMRDVAKLALETAIRSALSKKIFD